jgi:glycosyltransferase involved in cell wall biosynthesis
MHIYEIEDRMVDVIQHGNYLNMLGNPPEKMNAKECLGLPQNSKVLLFFGQIKEVKGLDIILDALPEVLLAYPEVILLVAGRPWKISFNTYLERMKKLGIQDKCICHIRYIDNDEVPIYYSAADLVLLPYRKIYQSGVVLMAMSYGKPVLVSDLPGMKEIVTDGVTGFIFTSGSSESLASRLKQILLMWEDVSLVAEIGLNHVKQNYSWSTVGNLTKEVYEKIIHPN